MGEGERESRAVGVVVLNYNGATIEILNWDKFNPRKDLKATSWFRLQNSLFEDPNFFEFSHAELLFWIYVLSLASKKQIGEIRLSYAHAERIGRFSKHVIESAMEKLVNFRCVRITHEVEHADVTSTLHARHTTNEQTDVTNETNEQTRPHADVAPESITDCMDEWKKTLAHFGITRKPIDRDELQIYQAIKLFSAEWVKLAFQGARKQKASKNFDPKHFVSLRIYLDPKRIERLVNIGAGTESAEGIDWKKVFEEKGVA